MFSFNDMRFDMQRIIDAYSADLDWDYTSVAWHAYGSSETTTLQIQDLMTRYRCVCTEWDYPGTYRYLSESLDGYEVHAGAFEQIGCGWIDWRDWGDASLEKMDTVLIPDAIGRDFYWGEGGGGGGGDGGGGLTMSVGDVDVTTNRKGKNYQAFASVLVVDATGAPVSGAEVTAVGRGPSPAQRRERPTAAVGLAWFPRNAAGWRAKP